MKKNLLFSVFMMMLVSVFTLTSCGSSKKAQIEKGGSSLGEYKVEKSPAQLYVESKNNGYCEWASYNGFANQDLESIAASVARAKLVENSKANIRKAIENYTKNTEVDSRMVNSTTANALSGEDKLEAGYRQLAEGWIKGARVVVSDRYAQKDGTHTCYVAVEVSPEGLLEQFEKNQQFVDAISETKKATIDFHSEKFLESMDKAFEDIKRDNE